MIARAVAPAFLLDHIIHCLLTLEILSHCFPCTYIIVRTSRHYSIHRNTLRITRRRPTENESRRTYPAVLR